MRNEEQGGKDEVSKHYHSGPDEFDWSLKKMVPFCDIKYKIKIEHPFPPSFNMDRSASASIASFTANPPLYSFPVPSFLAPLKSKSFSSLYTTLAILASLLVLEQAVYRYKKRHLPGAAWTIPLIGKFADSMAPSMEAYKRQWDSGALSAVSVFNMSVF